MLTAFVRVAQLCAACWWGFADFGERWRYDTTAKPIASGSWGRHLRIFFDQFYGEAIEVAPGDDCLAMQSVCCCLNKLLGFEVLQGAPLRARHPTNPGVALYGAVRAA